MKKMLNQGNQIHNFISSSASGTVINYGSGSCSDFISYGSGSTGQKVTVPVPVPQRCLQDEYSNIGCLHGIDPALPIHPDNAY